MKILGFVLGILGVLSITVGIGAWWYLGPVSDDRTESIFIVPEQRGDISIDQDLEQKRYIRHASGFTFLYTTIGITKEVSPGGYNLSKAMNTWEVLQKITGKPDLLWATTSVCLRREQIGEMIGKKLGWDEKKLHQWNTAYLARGVDYSEGVYFPDTYLIPVSETGDQVAERYISRFNEKFARFAAEAVEKNMMWTTVLKIASLIEREAAGPHDMPTIAGVIWNRLDTGMRLQIDATMQYTRGKKGDSWWGPVDLAEKRNESPYNTYLHTGLPPTPICSPGIDAIQAALNPEKTDCIFYLHDRSKQIHCAKEYEEHKENIRLYLQS